jgi:hypothetical protein
MERRFGGSSRAQRRQAGGRAAAPHLPLPVGKVGVGLEWGLAALHIRLHQHMLWRRRGGGRVEVLYSRAHCEWLLKKRLQQHGGDRGSSRRRRLVRCATPKQG